MVKYTNSERRLSIISDIIIFILLSISAFLILNIFQEIIKTSSLQSDELIEVSQTADLIEIENVKYVEKIKKEFGISVKYGISEKQLATQVDAVVQENSAIINNNLKLIYSTLGKYGVDMFNEISKEGYKISIVIFDSFNNDNLALASRNNMNQFTIYVSNVVRLERALHHEICHILEYYMSDKGKDFKYWEALNPQKFDYTNSLDNITSEYVYYLSKYSEENFNDTYFVTKYSKVNEKEDRAEIFAEIMSTTTSLEYIDDKTPIYSKYIYLFNTFKNAIPNAKFNNYYNVDF